ncbi:MAG TPA: Hint domain-containing protein [Candidatus Polarisedimenticolaceae bacterium]|nr:Hint domain-containing protein [Candidatus Polarisedimenticolaceae bacterium]
MVCRRIGVFVSVFATVLIAASLPALAVPCSQLATATACANQCYLQDDDGIEPYPLCTTYVQSTCSKNGVARVTYYCSDGSILSSGNCSCDVPQDPPGGCFLAGTPITMGDGSTKPIEEIQAGDTVFAYDEASKQMKPDKVKVVHPVVERDFYLVVNGKMKLTPNHRVLSKGEWVEIGQLAVGDTLTAPDGEPVPIEKIEKVEGKVKVYNFAVNPYETYVASGVIVHNRKQETTPPPQP